MTLLAALLSPVFCLGLGRAAQAAEPAAADETANAATPEAILAHPDSVEPFAYAQLITWLWGQGRREQATFWFYVMQARTRPWAQADHDGEGDGAAALRASLNDQLGQVINGWVASDPAAWKRIVERALSYEAHLPLNPARPDGMTEPAWLALVAKERAEYASGAHTLFAGLDPAAVAAQRRKAGLYNGPLQSPGPALPEDWR
ncbi:hypothetical protein NFI95_08000 [Acetobacteraceae bacterium KSS8]|uniref:Uncharacterized protein n=1 Tax=Endosaccharibacter trunci TaxID=2812733 RepID=A0ABT1W6K6_9PROT|nr:hypothetical protein [Acetobacteraceae bacterium KSS8]